MESDDEDDDDEGGDAKVGPHGVTREKRLLSQRHCMVTFSTSGLSQCPHMTMAFLCLSFSSLMMLCCAGCEEALLQEDDRCPQGGHALCQ
jgi:hypothetical protein